jgi:hypothetical protein
VSAVQIMVTAVEEALQAMAEDDIVIVHCLDNIAYMARSEEGGDLPVRRFVDNSYHIKGDLVLVSKERLLMFLKKLPPSVPTPGKQEGYLPHTWTEISTGWLLLSRGPCTEPWFRGFRGGDQEGFG